MLQSLKHRGPDSTGFAVYGVTKPDEYVMRLKLAEAVDQKPHEHPERRQLRRRADEQRDRRRRALVDVRDPHMERHGPELEGDTHHEEDEADDLLRLHNRLKGEGPLGVRVQELVRGMRAGPGGTEPWR